MRAMIKSRFKPGRPGALRKIVVGMSAAVMLALPGCLPQALATDPTDAMIRTAVELTEEYDLPDGLILAVCETESDFDPACVTGRCKGIMQIHSSYASDFAKAAGMDSYDPLDYADSMRIGAYLLSDYMTRYEGDIHFTLMAYNLGEYGALARRRDGVQSTGYSRKVVGRIEKWALVQLPESQEVEEASLKVEEETAALKDRIAEAIHEQVREVLFK